MLSSIEMGQGLEHKPLPRVFLLHQNSQAQSWLGGGRSEPCIGPARKHLRTLFRVVVIVATFSSCQIEVEINNAVTVLIAFRRAKLGKECRFEQRIRTYPNASPFNSTCIDTLVGLNMSCQLCISHDFRCLALVLCEPASGCVGFQDTSLGG